MQIPPVTFDQKTNETKSAMLDEQCGAPTVFQAPTVLSWSILGLHIDRKSRHLREKQNVDVRDTNLQNEQNSMHVPRKGWTRAPRVLSTRRK